MKNLTLYLWIAAGIAILVGVVYYLQQQGATAPDNTPASTGLGAAISGAIESAAQFATGTGNDLEDEDNGLIFGGGA